MLEASRYAGMVSSCACCSSCCGGRCGGVRLACCTLCCWLHASSSAKLPTASPPCTPLAPLASSTDTLLPKCLAGAAPAAMACDCCSNSAPAPGSGTVYSTPASAEEGMSEAPLLCPLSCSKCFKLQPLASRALEAAEPPPVPSTPTRQVPPVLDLRRALLPWRCARSREGSGIEAEKSLEDEPWFVSREGDLGGGAWGFARGESQQLSATEAMS